MNKNSTANTPSHGSSYLRHDAVLEVKGADALSFLQGQFSQDISQIDSRSAAIAGLSNPKGRLLSIAHIYRLDETCFWLILPLSMLEMVKTHLKKYVMRSKVEIEQKEQLHLIGMWGDRTEKSLTSKHHFKLTDFCNLHIAIVEEKPEQENLLDESLWTLQKITQGIPDIFPETSEHFVAQMLNLDLINGISFNKGCYTGQEIIARMQHLGRIKRRMLLIELNDEIAVGEKLVDNEISLGEVVNVTQIDSNFLALVCVQLDKLKNSDLIRQVVNLEYQIPELKKIEA